MKKQITTLCLLVILLFTTSLRIQAQTPDKQSFIAFWVQFKTAIKANDADFLFKNTAFPFSSEGGYFNTETSLQDLKDNYKQILPPYSREMEFVRFDIVMLPDASACMWLGYSFEEKAYFYCYKIMEKGGNLESDTYEEKYWFKKFNGAWKFFRMTAGNSGTEY